MKKTIFLFILTIISATLSAQFSEKNAIYLSSSISFIIEPKIEFPSSRYFGFTLSPMLQVNKDWTYVGVGIGLMGGLLRQKATY